MDGVDPSSPVPGMGHGAGSTVASMFYQTILDSKAFWDSTMEFEGTTKFTLPRSNGASSSTSVHRCGFHNLSGGAGTDGMRLAHQTWHHLVRDQIIRQNTW